MKPLFKVKPNLTNAIIIILLPVVAVWERLWDVIDPPESAEIINIKFGTGRMVKNKYWFK